jgi:hypothetical protein
VDDIAGPASCPECHEPLHEVGFKTAKHILRYEAARELREGRFLHCRNPACDLAYLRLAMGEPVETFRRGDMKDSVRPFAQGRDRLVCYCFGYTLGEIQDDVRQGNDGIATTIARDVRAGLCACEVMNPKGT